MKNVNHQTSVTLAPKNPFYTDVFFESDLIKKSRLLRAMAKDSFDDFSDIICATKNATIAQRS